MDAYDSVKVEVIEELPVLEFNDDEDKRLTKLDCNAR
jgi:hypothetical protein